MQAMQAIRGLAVTLFLLGGASAESCNDDGAQLDCAGVCGGNNEMHDCGIGTQICGKPDLCPSGFERKEGACIKLPTTPSTTCRLFPSLACYVSARGECNPFDAIEDVEGGYSFPAFVDRDNDGDLDLVIGRGAGDLFYYENTGSASNPSYTSRGYLAKDSSVIIDVGDYSAPAFVDMDKDGDLDLVIGRGAGDLFYYENTGSASNLHKREGALNPFHGINVGSGSAPVFVDTDNDGDLDLVIGRSAGDLQYYYENVGSWGAATPPVFTPRYKRRTSYTNPFNGVDVGSTGSVIGSVPAFVDTDNDGDLDLVIGRGDGIVFYYYENTGSASNPSYKKRTGALNPFDGVANVGSRSAPAFVDTDNDGDLDLVIGRKVGAPALYYYENIGNPLSNNAFAVFKAARNSMSETELLTALSAKQGSSC